MIKFILVAGFDSVRLPNSREHSRAGQMAGERYEMLTDISAARFTRAQVAEVENLIS